MYSHRLDEGLAPDLVRSKSGSAFSCIIDSSLSIESTVGPDPFAEQSHQQPAGRSGRIVWSKVSLKIGLKLNISKSTIIFYLIAKEIL